VTMNHDHESHEACRILRMSSCTDRHGGSLHRQSFHRTWPIVDSESVMSESCDSDGHVDVMDSDTITSSVDVMDSDTITSSDSGRVRTVAPCQCSGAVQ
jgi:hypothetical protein